MHCTSAATVALAVHASPLPVAKDALLLALTATELYWR